MKLEPEGFKSGKALLLGKICILGKNAQKRSKNGSGQGISLVWSENSLK